VKLPWPLRKAGIFFLSHGRHGAVDLPVQTAALPWRCTKAGGLEILLVTSRGAPRWLIPKGWPMRGKSLAEAAAREAFEEGGVEGQIQAEAIGSYVHVKNHDMLGAIRLKVEVRPLAVERELNDWPERLERARRWFGIEDAAATVASEELGVLIRDFDPAATLRFR
jgi:8-oxo-dGTP pyrophosphatase MutT (NUDIX family)